MAEKPAIQPALWGALAFAALMAIYFGALTLVSGWTFARGQFAQYGVYVVPLGAGFGIQIGLYAYLRRLVSAPHGSGTVVAASGTTSTAAMISCCAHYLANLAPVIGATGLATLAAQYQVEFFWVGLAFNAGGIAYVGSKVLEATKEHAKCIVV